MTISFDGGAVLCDVAGPADDRAWFMRHSGRSYRLRPAQLNKPGTEAGWVAVRQITPGHRVRLSFRWIGDLGQPPIEPPEYVARALFDLISRRAGAEEATVSAAEVQAAIQAEVLRHAEPGGSA